MSPEAFRALYVEHRDAVWRYALRRLGDRDAAEDATTEVFVVAWRRADAVPAGEPLPWLYGVARRVLANHRRGDARRRALDELVVAAPSVAADAVVPDLAGAVVDRDALRAGLAALSEGDREVVLLVAWEGLTVAEAAVVLGCRRSAAAVRLHRARKRLRAALDAADAPPPAPAAPLPADAPSSLPTPSAR